MKLSSKEENQKNDTDKNKNEATDKEMELLKEVGQMENEYPSGIETINIIGEIEGHMEVTPPKKATKYEHIIPMIIEVEENDDIKGVIFILNTIGGDVECGLAIAELIAGMTKPCVTLVLGGSHSIGVPLAVCGDYSFIVPTATMMIHPIRTSGLVIGVWQSFQYFKKMQERIISFVINHSKIDEENFRSLMLNTEELVTDVGSVLVGQQAVDIGLINQVGSLSQAREKLLSLISENEKACDEKDDNKKIKKSNKK